MTLRAGSQARRLLIVFLGRRGALAQFTLELLRAACETPGLEVSACISAHNELAEAIAATGARVTLLPLFRGGAGAALELWRAPGAAARLRRHIAETAPEAVLELMPHLWSPLFEGVYRAAGVPRACIAHDAAPHPGDPTALAQSWVLASALRADRVLTLSRFAADRLIAARRLDPTRVTALFHPDFASAAASAPRVAEAPLCVLFLGRIQRYKGLDILVEAVETLRRADRAVRLGVFGEGALGDLAPRLAALEAEVRNHWLSGDEIADALSRYDVVAAPHQEITQSGVVASAFGAGRPVVATPVGALPEQVRHNGTGLIAAAPDAAAFAAVLDRLLSEPGLLARLSAQVRAEAQARSMRAFLRAAAATLGLETQA